MTEARGAALAFVAALGATLLMAAPVALAPTERLFGSSRTFAPDDPNRDPLVVIDQFRTGRVPGPYLQPLTDLPGRALARLVGPVAAYNVVVLASFPLAAAAAYMLARYVLGSHLAGMVAGLAYAFLPFHVAHASHHPHVAQTQWLPLYFLALCWCLDRPDVRRGAVLLGAAAAVTLSNFYAGLIAAALSPVALVAYGVVAPRPPSERRFKRVAVTGLTLAAAPLLGLVLIHLLAPAVLHLPRTFAFPRSDLFLHSATWWSYLLPPVDHPLAGSWARQIWAGSGVETALLEQQVGVGWSLLALAVVPVALWLRGDRTSLALRSVPFLVSVAAASFLCSLSPESRIGPWAIVRPSALLYEVAPMFRAYARFGVVAGLMTTMLSGAGAAWLWRRPTPAGRRAAVILLSLAVLEMAPFPPWRWRDVLPTQAHRWVATQSGALRVLDCVLPLRVSDSLAVPLLGHPLSLLGAPDLPDCGEPQLGEKLKAMHYTHVVSRRGSAAARWLESRAAPVGLAPGPQFDDSAIWEVNAEPPGAYVSALVGFHPREYEGDQTWRWMPQTGALTIVAPGAPVDAVLEMEMKSFPGERRIEWLVGGRSLGTLQVTPEWRRYAMPLRTLPRGATALTLASREPAAVAHDVLHNGDPRVLGLAVGDWRLRSDLPPGDEGEQ